LFVWWATALILVWACASKAPQTRVVLIEIQTADVQRAVTFYRAVFGWEVSFPDSSYAVLEAQPVPIGLAERDSVVQRRTGIVISVEDLESVLALVEQHGGTVQAPIHAAAKQGLEFVFADLDGNEIVVWSERRPADGGAKK
jgi:predicted enzyme related to lactoylglutathione lyase